MGLPRSTFYDVPATPADEAVVIGRMRAICDEFESYGYRRVRYRGLAANQLELRMLCIAFNMRKAAAITA